LIHLSNKMPSKLVKTVDGTANNQLISQLIVKSNDKLIGELTNVFDH
jgi:hypothetical protein